MKIKHHERKPDSRTVGTQLDYNPMRVFLSGTVELLIEKGDVLDEVARQLEVYWFVTSKQARQIVAFWFSLGERRISQKAGWEREELDARPNRRYCQRATVRGGSARRSRSRRP